MEVGEGTGVEVAFGVGVATWAVVGEGCNTGVDVGLMGVPHPTARTRAKRGKT